MKQADWKRFIRLTKQALGWTSLQLATQMKLSKSSVDKWLYRGGGYRIGTYQRVCDVLERHGIDPADLVRRAYGAQTMKEQTRAMMKFVTDYEMAVLDAWSLVQKNPSLLKTIEFHLANAGIKSPNRRLPGGPNRKKSSP